MNLISGMLFLMINRMTTQQMQRKIIARNWNDE